MFTSPSRLKRGFMGPLDGRSGDRHHEDVYGRINADEAGEGTVRYCESESGSDDAVQSVQRKEKAIDSYGRIKKGRGELAPQRYQRYNSAN